MDSGNCLHTLVGHQSLTSGMELKNNILVSGNADSTVKVWDITTGQCLQTLQGTCVVLYLPFYVKIVTFSSFIMWMDSCVVISVLDGNVLFHPDFYLSRESGKSVNWSPVWYLLRRVIIRNSYLPISVVRY